MSLKAFHIVFIVASIILSAVYGAWQIRIAAAGGIVLDWCLGIFSVVTGTALVFYLFCFVRKMRQMKRP